MIRRWVLGIECKHLEVQKLGWFLARTIRSLEMDDPLDLQFAADKYGPYSDRLHHLLDGLHGTYLHCDKRLRDAGPSDTIWFDEGRRKHIDLFFQQKANRQLERILDITAHRIDGFESPLGLELLATIGDDRLAYRTRALRTLPRRHPKGLTKLARRRFGGRTKNALIRRSADRSRALPNYCLFLGNPHRVVVPSGPVVSSSVDVETTSINFIWVSFGNARTAFACARTIRAGASSWSEAWIM